MIVPVYNAQDYLDRCLTSLVGQTMEELEFILVDDGSTDSSGQLCDRWAEKDPRIRVLHKENGGLSSARNIGIDMASCDLVGFVDSDDWVEPDMFELLYTNLVAEGADISSCGIFYDYPKHIHTSPDTTGYYVMDSRAGIHAVMDNVGVSAYVWNKIYKKQLFSTIRFPLGKLYEDDFISLKLVDAAEKMVSSLVPKYHYIQRQGSLCRQGWHPGERHRLEAAESNYRFVEENYPEHLSLARYKYVQAHYSLLDRMLLSEGFVDPKERRGIVRFLRRNTRSVLKTPKLSKIRKISAVVLFLNVGLYKVLVKMAQKRTQRLY